MRNSFSAPCPINSGSNVKKEVHFERKDGLFFENSNLEVPENNQLLNLYNSINDIASDYSLIYYRHHLFIICCSQPLLVCFNKLKQISNYYFNN